MDLKSCCGKKVCINVSILGKLKLFDLMVKQGLSGRELGLNRRDLGLSGIPRKNKKWDDDLG